MLLACLALAIVAPSLSAWSHGTQLRDLADQFVSLTRLARSRAVADGFNYRINIDAKGGTYQLMVEGGGNFVPMQSAWGRLFTMPDGIELQLLSSTGGAPDQPAIDFYPTGRVQPATVKITSARGETIQINCPSPAEGFVIAQPNGGAR